MSNEETVRCDFQAGGISQAKEAFRTMEQSLARLEKLALKYHDVDERGALKAAKAEQSTAQARVKTAVTFADARDEIAKREDKKRIDGAKALFSGLEKLEKEHTRSVAAEAAKRERAEAAANAAVAKRRSQMGSAITGGVGRTLGMGAGQYGGLSATMGVGLGATFAIADAAKNYMSTEKAAINLANSMYNPNGEDDGKQADFLKKHGKNGRFDKEKLMAFAADASAASGVDKTEFLTGAQSYIAKSSDWEAMATEGGKKRMTDMAKLAVGSGTDFGQLMSAAGSLKVQNPRLDDNGMMEMLRNIIGQGKMGAVEISDLAQHASVITAGAGKYKVGEGGYKDQADAQNALLGLSQIAIRTSGSAAEAATAVKDFGSDIGSHGDKMEKNFAGLHVKDKKGALLSNATIVENLFNATGGDMSKMGQGKGHIGLGRESVRIMDALKVQFDQGVAEAKAKNPKASDKELTKAGAAAAAREVRKFENAKYSEKDAERDHAEVVAAAGKRIEMASTRIRQALEVKMAPVVERIADKFVQNEKGLTSLANALGKVAEFLLDNPYKGIALLIAGSVTKELASAAIGEAVKKALVSAIGGGGTPAPTPGPGGGRGGVVAPAVGTGIGAALVISKAMMGYEAGNDHALDLEAKVQAYQRGDRKNGIAPEVAMQEVAAARKRLDNGSVLEHTADLATSPFSEASDKAYSQYKADQGLTENAVLQRTLKELTDAAGASAAALRTHATTAGAANPNNPNRNVPMSHEARGGT